MKDSLFKRVAAIENRGVGLQIRTLADYVIWCARGARGSPTIEPQLKAALHRLVEHGRQRELEQCWQTWNQMAGWLA